MNEPGHSFRTRLTRAYGESVSNQCYELINFKTIFGLPKGPRKRGCLLDSDRPSVNTACLKPAFHPAFRASGALFCERLNERLADRTPIGGYFRSRCRS